MLNYWYTQKIINSIRDPYSQWSSWPRRLQSHFGRLRYLQKSPFGQLRFCSTTKSFQKFLYDFIHFPCVLITSLIHFKLLEWCRIISSFCLQWNCKFGHHLWWCSIFYETMAGSVFCEVLHSEAIHRKRDSNHQDLAFFRRHFIAFGRKKKVKQKPVVPYMF